MQESFRDDWRKSPAEDATALSRQVPDAMGMAPGEISSSLGRLQAAQEEKEGFRMAGQDRNPRRDSGMINFLEGVLIAYLGFLILLGWIVYLGYRDLQNKKKALG